MKPMAPFSFVSFDRYEFRLSHRSPLPPRCASECAPHGGVLGCSLSESTSKIVPNTILAIHTT
eukprot:9473864-Pyramimonas_sp.AAC.2